MSSIQHSTYNKNERLKSRKLIEELFGKGKSLFYYPLKVLFEFVDIPNHPLLQGGVSVSSKKFKKAVDRNRTKRLMREAYRLHKLPLQTALALHHRHLVVFFIYTGKGLPSYADIYAGMGEVVKRLTDSMAPKLKD